MDRVLETLIANASERDTMNPKALTALNIMMKNKYGEEYRLLMYSSLLERDIKSSKELSIGEVYGLLKFVESAKHDSAKPL